MMTELKDVRNGHVLREKMRIAGERVGGDRAIDAMPDASRFPIGPC